MYNSSSSVLVLIRTFLSLLHTYVVDLLTAQLFIAIQHTGNSYLHQHIPRKRLRASSQCLLQYIELLSPHSWGYDQTAAGLILQEGVSLSWLSSASFCLQCVTYYVKLLVNDKITALCQVISLPSISINRCKQQKMNSE